MGSALRDECGPDNHGPDNHHAQKTIECVKHVRDVFITWRDNRMILRRVALTGLFTTLGLMAGSQIALGQRLYDKGRDDKAQEAKKQAATIETGAVFDKQLKNLSAVSHQDFDVYFLGVKRVMRSGIDAFITWRGVEQRVRAIARAINTPNAISDEELQGLRKELSDAKTAAQASLNRLKTKAKQTGNGALSNSLGRVGDIQSVLDFADKLPPKDQPANSIPAGPGDESSKANTNLAGATSQVKATLGALQTLYDSYSTRLDEIDKVSVQLNALKLPLEQLAMEKLEVEEEHWKTVGAINARREAEQGDLKDLAEDFNDRMRRLNLIDSGEKIEDTIRDAVDKRDRERLADLILTLHVAAALLARGSTPEKLAELRLAQEEHRFSIRQSAVMARAYELTVSAGVERLALYYQGGIKPATIAQLLQAIGTAVVIPTSIATK